MFVQCFICIYSIILFLIFMYISLQFQAIRLVLIFGIVMYHFVKIGKEWVAVKGVKLSWAPVSSGISQGSVLHPFLSILSILYDNNLPKQYYFRYLPHLFPSISIPLQGPSVSHDCDRSHHIAHSLGIQI